MTTHFLKIGIKNVIVHHHVSLWNLSYASSADITQPLLLAWLWTLKALVLNPH